MPLGDHNMMMKDLRGALPTCQDLVARWRGGTFARVRRENGEGAMSAKPGVREWPSALPHEKVLNASAQEGLPQEDSLKPGAKPDKPKQILIADDDALVRSSLAVVLE